MNIDGREDKYLNSKSIEHALILRRRDEAYEWVVRSNHTQSRKLHYLLLASLFLLVAGCFDVSERGPYLQNPSSTTMVVKWRTSKISKGTVLYGINEKSLTMSLQENTQTSDHEIELVNLRPNTRYYYKVSDLNGDVYNFTTFPVEGTAKPSRIWILGDSGKKGAEADSVISAFYDFNGSPSPDLMILLGDNAYTKGKDKEYEERFF